MGSREELERLLHPTGADPVQQIRRLVVELLRKRLRRAVALRELSQLTQEFGGYDQEMR